MWSHVGMTYRVTPWPEAAIERLCGESWVACHLDDGSFAAAAADLREIAWRRYLEYVPNEERAFVSQFRFGRLEALQVVARCPDLLPVLREYPALTVFLSAHVSLRGSERPGWDEINAVFQRTGIYGVLEWLGLPATPHTLAALHNFADPEIPRRFLAPLRTAFWHGPTLVALEKTPVVTDLDLARHCHVRAA